MVKWIMSTIVLALLLLVLRQQLPDIQRYLRIRSM
ncbi:DUF6893 family small protein [Thermogemmatispora carboxidivorans]